MKIFIAASYSSKVDYDTGKFFPECQAWLEDVLSAVERQGHAVFCTLLADQYRINGTARRLLLVWTWNTLRLFDGCIGKMFSSVSSLTMFQTVLPSYA